MNKANGFIVLHRKILDWEWASDINTFGLFVHLLLAANFVEGRFKGKEVKRGQLITSLPSLSTNTGLSIQQIRTALAHLVSTGEITDDATRQYRVITILKYDEYQKLTDKSTDDQQTSNSHLTDEQQMTNRRSTDDQQQYNNNNNNNKETKKQSNKGDRTASRFTPPTLEDVRAYCQERGNKVDPQRWLDYYTSNGWMVGRNRMKDWKAAVRTWERQDNERAVIGKPVIAQQYEQRDYSQERESFDDMLERLGI